MKYINWSLLTDDLLEILILNQETLANKCGVTQQSISNWRTGVRSPGVRPRAVLRQLCEQAKLKLEDYHLDAFSKKRLEGLSGTGAPISGEVLEFSKRLSLLSPKKYREVINMAEFMITR